MTESRRWRSCVDPARRERTAVYRYFDAAAVFLYVGVTKDLQRREAAHRMHSRNIRNLDLRGRWYPLAVRKEVEWFDFRGDAEDAEQRYITEGRPIFNVHGTEDAAAAKARADEYLMAAGRRDLVPPFRDGDLIGTGRLADLLDIRYAEAEQAAMDLGIRMVWVLGERRYDTWSVLEHLNRLHDAA